MVVGVLGAGKISQKHINALKKFNDIDIKVSDINSDQAKRLSGDLDIGFEKNPDNLIKSNRVDVIDVCTPVNTHKSIILKSIRNDKHVFCEKPLCTSINDAYEIKGAAEATNRTVAVGYLYRFHPAIRELKRIVDEGVIGEPYYASFRLGARGSHREWKHKDEEGGGVLNEISVHKVDLINWIFGTSKEAKLVNHSLILGQRNVDGNNIEATAKDLFIADYKTDSVEVHLHTDIFTAGFIEFIEVMGKNGSVFTSILDYMPTIVYLKDEKGKYNEGQNVTRYDAVDLFESQFKDFFSSVKSNKKSLNTIESSIKVMKTINSLTGRE
jgi:predicted dehydrogenase